MRQKSLANSLVSPKEKTDRVGRVPRNPVRYHARAKRVRLAACQLTVNRDVSTGGRSLPLLPKEQIFSERVGISRKYPVSRHAAEQKGHYSITSSARARSVGGISSPSAFAALRLITNSSLFGNSTGRSDGLAPLRILTT